MIRYLCHFCILLLMAGMASCASYKGFPERVINPDVELNSLACHFSQIKIDQYNAAIDEATRFRIRNEIINGRLAAIDVRFSIFQRRLIEEGIDLNVGTDAVMLGLGAAGALVSGGTSKILSATSAAVIGMKESVDKNVFYKQTMPALFAQMVAQRKKVLVKIRTGLTKNSADYPLEEGFVDLGDYEYAGSIPGALASVVEDAGAKSARATERLDKILVYKMDRGAQSLEEYLAPINPDGTFDQGKVQRIKACWRRAGVPPNTIFVDFIFESIFAEKRKEVMDCVNSSQP